MTPNEFHKAIRAAGWEPESDLNNMAGAWHRATCGGFVTPWRGSWLDVLPDVLKLKEKNAAARQADLKIV